MSIRILLTFLLLSFALPSFSQEEEQDSVIVKSEDTERVRKGFIGLSAGPAFPSGNYGSSNWDNEEAGFANNGYNFTGIDFGYKFVPAFGLALSFKGANIPLDVQAIANNYAQEYGGQFFVKSTRWNYGGIYVGPIVSIPTRFIDIDFRFMTGLMLAFTPELEIVRGLEYVRQEAAVGPSISIALGTGVRVHVTKRLDLTAGIEYLRGRPVFNLEYSSNNTFESETVYQNITTVNTSFGFAFRIF